MKTKSIFHRILHFEQLVSWLYTAQIPEAIETHTVPPYVNLWQLAELFKILPLQNLSMNAILTPCERFSDVRKFHKRSLSSLK